MLKGITALVTGGGSGLGRATVEHLSKLGARVLLADLPTSDGEKVAKSLGDVVFSPVDVTNESDVQKCLQSASNLKNLKLVVNCAGIGAAQRTLDFKKNAPHTLAGFQKVLQVNTVGTFNVIRLSAAILSKNEPDVDGSRGLIVNTASIAAYDGQIGQCAYSASKGAIVAMTLPIARDLGPMGIRVVTIAPGLFETPLLKGLLPAVKNNLLNYSCFPKRLGKPEEYAKFVEHLYYNNMFNGCVIRLDAGMRMPA